MFQVYAIKGFMWKPAEKLSMTEEHCKTLKAWVWAKTSPQRIVLRARICLLAADGLPNRIIAQTLKTSRPTVVQWRKRFKERGPGGLAEDAPHGLSTRALSAEKIGAIVEATLHCLCNHGAGKDNAGMERNKGLPQNDRLPDQRRKT